MYAYFTVNSQLKNPFKFFFNKCACVFLRLFISRPPKLLLISVIMDLNKLFCQGTAITDWHQISSRTIFYQLTVPPVFHRNDWFST